MHARSSPTALYAALLITLALAACGGSGSGGDGIDLDPFPSSDDSDPDSPLPNFTILDFATAPRTNGRDLTASATILNNGETAATVPEGWLQVSGAEDFSEGWMKVDVRLRPINPTDSSSLEPGEERTFIAASVASQDSVFLGLARDGLHYARLWINPDLSAHFENPELQVVESYEAAEVNYGDNQSESIAFMAGDEDDPTLRGCEADEYEQNDSLDAAAPLSLNTTFDVNDCDDRLDVFDVDLVEGDVYSLVDTESDTLVVQYDVVDPANLYAARSLPLGGVFRASTGGTHKLVVTIRSGQLGHFKTLAFENVQ